MVFGRYSKELMELCHNGLQAQLSQFTGCGVVKVYIVLPEVMSVDDGIMACTSWWKKKWCGDIQENDVLVAGFFAVGLNDVLDAPDSVEVGLFVCAW